MSTAKVHMNQGGDKMTVADGGEIDLGSGVTLSVSGANVLITGLPTSDPSVAGALYTDTGVLTVSSG